jgi:class 3 adenylate cyclase
VWWLGTEERRRELPTAALDAAFTSVERVRETLRAHGLDETLGIRIGLHSGRAAFGNFGTRDRIAVTVLGRDVNLASRYEQAKDERLGPVRISPSMKALVERSAGAASWSFVTCNKVKVKHGLEIDVFCPTRRGVEQ